MQNVARGSDLDRTFRFSTPPRDSPAFGSGTAAAPAFQPPEINNCLNAANELTRVALDGRDMIVVRNGRNVNLATARYVDTGDPVPDMLPAAAKNMKEYLSQWDEEPLAQGLTRTRVSGGMILLGVTGVLRVGGVVLLIYNLGRVADRYEAAPQSEKAAVVGEEATLFAAAAVAGLLGEILGETVICVGAGPAAGLCVIATAAIVGVAGGMLASDTATEIGRDLQTSADLQREGKLLPAVMDVATKVFGSEEDQKKLNQLKQMEKQQPSDGMFDLFHFD